MLLLSGGLQLPFYNITTNSINRFVAAAVGKVYKIHTEKLHKLGAPWLTDQPVDVNAVLILRLSCTILYLLGSLTIFHLYEHVTCELKNEWRAAPPPPPPQYLLMQLTKLKNSYVSSSHLASSEH